MHTSYMYKYGALLQKGSCLSLEAIGYPFALLSPLTLTTLLSHYGYHFD